MMSTPPVPPVADTVGRLVDVCRDGQVGFANASRAVADPIFRAELLQYSGQRSEFVAELNEALRAAGEAPIPPASPTAPALTDHWAGLDAAIAQRTRRAILDACQEAELASVEVYRRALGAGLPTRVVAVVHTQFIAISRVRDRLQSLIVAEAATPASGYPGVAAEKTEGPTRPSRR